MTTSGTRTRTANPHPRTRARGASGALLCALLCTLSTGAKADAFTFDFTLPAWDYNSNAPVYGTGLDLSITVDNGASSARSQSWTYGDITGITVSAIGGSFSFSSQGIAPSFEDKGVAPLVTDGSGVATLSFLVSDPAQAGHIDWNDGKAFFQLGQETSGAIVWLPVYSFLQPPYGPEGGGTASYYGGIAPYDPKPLVSLSQAVPEPATSALMLAGLALLSWKALSSRRRSGR